MFSCYQYLSVINKNIIWQVKPFTKLNTTELYAILRLRAEVFVVEQDCVYQDVDNKDLNSWHIMAWDGDILVAYARLVDRDISYPDYSIGRILTNINYRKTGIGIELMEKSIAWLKDSFGSVDVRISAQCYLQKFYEKFGFKKVSDSYLEDNILHIEMLVTI